MFSGAGLIITSQVVGLIVEVVDVVGNAVVVDVGGGVGDGVGVGNPVGCA